MSLRDFLRTRLNRGPVSVPMAAHDAWSAGVLGVDRIADGYGKVRAELMAMTEAGEAKHYDHLECWTIPASTPIPAVDRAAQPLRSNELLGGAK